MLFSSLINSKRFVFLMSTEEQISYESQLSTNSNVLQYGPIQVRMCRKLAPTLATGRRSKHMTLQGEEAAKREKRREKNRLAAKKLKEKRQMVEDELNKEIRILENEHSDLKTYLSQLRDQKQFLEFQIQRFFPTIDDLTMINDDEAIDAFFNEYLGDFDLDDEFLESIFDSQLTDDQT